MIPIDGSARIYVATQPLDFRCGVQRMMSLVTHSMGFDGCGGDVFIFRNRRGDKVRLLFHDGSGAVLATKWPDRGKFVWPPVQDGVMLMSAAQCAALVSGLDWQKLPYQAPKRPRYYC